MRSRLPQFNTRVLTVILLVAIPVVIAGAAVVINIGQSRLRNAEKQRLAQVAEYTAGAVDSYVFRRILDGALLARVPDIQRAAEAGSAVPFDAGRSADSDRQWQKDPAGAAARSGVLSAPASRFLADLISNDSVYREVLVTDRHGRLVAASNITSDFAQADEDWWTRAFDGGRGRISVTDVRRDESAGVYAFEIAVPVHAPGKPEVAGVMKIVADSREMLAGVAGLELGQSSEGMLVRPDGSIVFSRRPHDENARFFGADLLREELASRADSEGASGTITLEGRNSEGTPRIAALAPTQLARNYPELPWMVALSVDRDELVAPFRSLVLYIILVFALTGIAVLASALWASLRLASPPIDPAYDMHLVEHPPMPRMGDVGPTA